MKSFYVLFCTVTMFLCLTGSLSAKEDRFSVLADKGVVIDKATGLMWPLQDNDSDISWPAGKEYCEQFSLGGFSDWRMPTQEELASLYDLKAADLTEYYMAPAIKISACCLWAMDTRNPKVASFDFEYGNRDWGYPMSTVEARVLPVRNAQ